MTRMHGYPDARGVLNAASDKEINNPDAASKRSVKRRRRINPSARINPAKPGFRRELRSPALHSSLTEHRLLSLRRSFSLRRTHILRSSHNGCGSLIGRTLLSLRVCSQGAARLIKTGQTPDRNDNPALPFRGSPLTVLIGNSDGTYMRSRPP